MVGRPAGRPYGDLPQRRPLPRVLLNDLIPGRYSLAGNVLIPSLPRPVVGATGGRPYGNIPQCRRLPTGSLLNDLIPGRYSLAGNVSIPSLPRPVVGATGGSLLRESAAAQAGLVERVHPGPVFLGEQRLDTLAAAASGGGDRRVAPTGICRSAGAYPRVLLNEFIPGRYSLASNVSIPSLPRPVAGATGGSPLRESAAAQAPTPGLVERVHPGPVFLGERLDTLAAAASGGGDRRVAPTGICRSAGAYPRVLLNDLIPGRYSLAGNVSIPSLPRPVVGATGGSPLRESTAAQAPTHGSC